MSSQTVKKEENPQVSSTNTQVPSNAHVSRTKEDNGDNLNCLSKLAKCCQTNFLVFATCTGVFVGVLIGILVNQANAENVDDQDGYTPRDVMHVKFIGQLFLRMLQGIILPLITSSLIAAVSNLDATLSGKVGGRALAWYVCTTILAITLGLVLVTTIQPGAGVQGVGNQPETYVLMEDAIFNLLRNLFPSNIIRACTNQHGTTLVKPPDGLTQRQSYAVNSSDKSSWDFKQTEEGKGTNMIGLIAFSIIVGIAIGVVGDPAESMKAFFLGLAAVMMKITQWVIYLAPIGVCFLVAGAIMEMEKPAESFKKLGYYFATVCLGLLIHGFATLPILFYLLTRRSPYTFWLNMTQAMSTAFGTASSLATLPTTIKCLEEKNKIDTRVARLVPPIGATINMDGTALYFSVAVIFIAQVREVDLGVGGLISIAIISTTGSIGAAGIPNAGLVMLVLLLDTVGLPSEDIGLILAVDWLLDRFQTVINILGDSVGTAVVYHLSKEELHALDTGRTKAEN